LDKAIANKIKIGLIKTLHSLMLEVTRKDLVVLPRDLEVLHKDLEQQPKDLVE